MSETPTKEPSSTPPASSEPTTTTKQAMQLGVLVLIFLLALNGAFFFLSDLYFADRVKRFDISEALAINHVRVAFAIFTISVGAASVLAGLAPRWIGHGLAGLAAIASLFGAYGAWIHDMPGVLSVTLVLVALLIPVLIWRSWVRSRGAWSFLIALMGVYALIMLFGAPKVRSLLEIGLWTAMIVPGLLAIGCVSLVMLHRDYQDR